MTLLSLLRRKNKYRGHWIIQKRIQTKGNRKNRNNETFFFGFLCVFCVFNRFFCCFSSARLCFVFFDSNYSTSMFEVMSWSLSECKPHATAYAATSGQSSPFECLQLNGIHAVYWIESVLTQIARGEKQNATEPQPKRRSERYESQRSDKLCRANSKE